MSAKDLNGYTKAQHQELAQHLRALSKLYRGTDDAEAEDLLNNARWHERQIKIFKPTT